VSPKQSREQCRVEILEHFIYPVLDEMGDQVTGSASAVHSPDTPLFTEGGLFDSMGLVSFIVSVEDRIEDETDTRITLATDKAMSRSVSPFRSLGALRDYIAELLDEAGRG
jgi:hypothetical protein